MANRRYTDVVLVQLAVPLCLAAAGLCLICSLEEVQRVQGTVRQAAIWVGFNMPALHTLLDMGNVLSTLGTTRVPK